MREQQQFDGSTIQAFLALHGLPPEYREAIDDYFLPLAAWLEKHREDGATLVIGINGAQGTGKSTLGDFLAIACHELYGWTTAVLSIDDFYLTRDERVALAETRHPLLRTRGVPGTHDVGLLSDALDRLCGLAPGETYTPPRFDKSTDDRAKPPWPSITGPVDMVILEGWCVGTSAEAEPALAEPVNALERGRDEDGTWRSWVNDQLRDDYGELWSRLDALVFIRAPGFDAIYAWRLEQEHKLAARVGADAEGIMSDAEVRDFINYYERLTRHNIATLGDVADVVFELDETHAVTRATYRS